MKLRTWLLLSYLLVMILPLVTAYLLFAWINAFHNDQKVEEYLQKWSQLQHVISVLDDPLLYRETGRDQVDRLISPQLSIVLYNRDGLVLYTSDPMYVSPQLAPSKSELYQNLYSLEQGYRAYSYKQPVFAGHELVGFFEVNLSRDEWAAGVAKRTWMMVGLFVGLFVLIYLTVMILVHRKLNSRLNRLMQHMTAFANQETVEQMPAGKDEIGTLMQHFYQMQNQIEKARAKIAKEQQEKEYMIATISHDLKTPLTSIRAYAESLTTEQDLSVHERQEYHKIIVDKANYMHQMLDDLLMYTLLQSPAYEMEFVEVDGSEFFEMLVSDYEPLCKARHIHLDVYCAVTGNYLVNPNQMIRVADNLMSNAIQHTQQGAHIGLAAVSADWPLPEWLFPFVQEQVRFDCQDRVFLIVQNEGEGIAKEKLAHVFEPLYQADQAGTKQDARRTGLGLSITKQIMEKHGGDVHIVSQEGIGTCIICHLPQRRR
ncbi:signal transduction histidine kinase [Caldalkalibacillus uzonensis]|uniref:histidine kinase n=1 Tax=Caldalkalibacillus uzonensis TaxID=353224 RepID=A0ABU0CY86_9BACI|nr:HAMP domain-containing sensor histidine kinase [Caldalkalibacillus uzonensis]MDQ0341123.1 signal transduction histidine kinase [Caldalkalibacillus uzonensis]